MAEPTEQRAKKRRRILSALIVAGAAETIMLRRRGYSIGGNVVVRCHQGHLFTTIWIPMVSFKAARLGWWRFQRCPVGRHWSLVHPVKLADLAPEERRSAAEHKDIRIP